MLHQSGYWAAQQSTRLQGGGNHRGIRDGQGVQFGEDENEQRFVFNLLFYSLLNLLENIGLRVRHGKQERVFRLEFISNQEFTDSEYEKWVDATSQADIQMPTREDVQRKQADIKEALNYEFNEQDIERIVSSIGHTMLLKFHCKNYKDKSKIFCINEQTATLTAVFCLPIKLNE